jgi:hemolysin activation/secretion protein
LGEGGQLAGSPFPVSLARGARRAAGAGACAAALVLVATSAIAAEQKFDILAIDVDGNTLLDRTTLETVIYPFMGPSRTRGDVEAAQKALEAAYRAKGYQSVLVEIPRQGVESGVIKLHVVEEPIGQLRVVGSKYHSLAAIREAVPALAEGKVADFGAAQTEINDLNRLPDRQVTPIIRAGAAPGTIDVDLKVADEPPLHASVELNNAHSAFTVPLRTTVNVRYDNLWQRGHSASFTYVVAPQRPSDGQVFAASYMAPLWGTPFSFLAFGYNSNSDVATIGGVSVLGKGSDVGVRAIYQFAPRGPISQSLSLGLDYKHFDELVHLDNGQTSPGVVTYAPLNATYTLRRQAQSSTTATLALTANFRALGDNDRGFETKRADARANFIRFNLDVEHLQPLWAGFEGDLRLSAQTTNTALVSSEQFALGGANSVRGYLEAEATVDDGAFGSVEVRTPELLRFAPKLVNDFKLFTFFDAGGGRVRFPQAEQQGTFRLMSTGVGARFQFLEHLSGDATVGIPLKPGPTRDQTGRAYGSFSVKAAF